jgi:hypothetical protein
LSLTESAEIEAGSVKLTKAQLLPPSVEEKTPSATVDANNMGAGGPMIDRLTMDSPAGSPLFAAFQLVPPSVLLNTPSSLVPA